MSKVKCNQYDMTKELMSLIRGESEHRIIKENLAEILGCHHMLHVGRVVVS